MKESVNCFLAGAAHAPLGWYYCMVTQDRHNMSRIGIGNSIVSCSLKDGWTKEVGSVWSIVSYEYLSKEVKTCVKECASSHFLQWKQLLGTVCQQQHKSKLNAAKINYLSSICSSTGRVRTNMDQIQKRGDSTKVLPLGGHRVRVKEDCFLFCHTSINRSRGRGK